MSKTLGSILLVAAAVAVNVIPGVGQAISGAIVGLAGGPFAAGAATAWAIGDAVASAVTLGVTAAGLQSAAGLLGLGPSAPKPDTAITAIKTSRPPRVSGYGESRLYGAYVLYETASDGTAVDVYAVHDGELTQVVQRYLGDDKITLTGNIVDQGSDGRYRDSKVSFYTTTGVNPGPGIPAVTAKVSEWTGRGDGVVLMGVLCAPAKSKHFLETYPNGVPEASIAAKWQKCPDFHAIDPTDESGWTWTENSIRQLGHYKMVREGDDYATKIAPTLAYWQAAQDVCDEAIPLKAGGTEARWRSCVAHKHIDSHGAVTAALLETCDGWIAPRSDGALVVYAGKYYAPTVSIGPDEIVAFEWSGVGVDDDEAVNELICSYVSANHDYNSVETDAWRDEDDISERGQVLSSDFSPQTPSWGQSRRGAKRKMARSNALHRGTVTTNIAGRVVRGERYINLNLTDAGTTFYSGPAEIVAVTRNMATGGVTFQWVSADPNIDNWNAATEEGDPAAKGDRVAQEPVLAPTVASALATFSGDNVTLTITANSPYPTRSDLTWLARWRTAGASVWGGDLEFGDVAPGSTVTLTTDVVPLDGDVEVEVALRLGDGRYSDWSAPSHVTTSVVTTDTTTQTADTVNITVDRG
jgi:hypothetical protein